MEPISLCNDIHTLISKILFNDLKVLPHIISKTQSAFVLRKLIADNILVAFETLHHMKNYCKGKQRSMAFKVNMSQAYDKAEWDLLRVIMEN